MPMYQLLEEMPSQELLRWSEYLQARPIGWREDHRAAMIMSAQGAKIKPAEIFPTIKQVVDWENRQEKTEEDSNRSLRSSIFGGKLQEALEMQKNKDKNK